MKASGNRLVSVFVAVCMVAFSGCSQPGGEREAGRGAADRLTVYVANYPLQYFAERIGGDRVEVVFPAPPDEDPAYWNPDADTVAAYQAADLILLNGADYARWAKRVSLPSLKVVDTSAAFRDRFIKLEEAVTHSHGPEGAHEHVGVAFTTWLDPTLAAMQAQAVRDALSRAAPDGAADFDAGCRDLEIDLKALDTRLASVSQKIRTTPVVVSHPVYQYLQRRYDWNARSVHWEPNEPPTEEMWGEFRALLAEHPAQWMIWEGDPAPETVAALADLGVGSVVFDPCGNVPDEGDFFGVMERNVAALERAFGGSGH